MGHEINIKREGGHYAIYINGVFFCTADTYLEAVEELEKEGYI